MDEQKNKLSSLIEQTAAKVTLLGPDETDEMTVCQKLIDDILSAAVEIDGVSEQVLSQLKNLSGQASQLLGNAAQKDQKDAAAAIQTINTLVCDMQTLVQEIENASGSNEKNTGTPPAAAPMQFAEEDIPLILDFINESREHIEAAEAGLLELENNPEDQETLNRIFRSFHTIKGMSGFLNLMDINKLAHAAENLLDMARKGQLRLVGAFSDATFASIDMLKSIISLLEKAINDQTPYTASSNLDGLLAVLHDCASGKIKADSAPICDAAPKTEKPQPLSETDDHKIDTLLTGEKEPASASAATASAVTAEKIKVSTVRLDELINMTGELAVAQLMISEQVGKTCDNDSDLYRSVSHQNKIVRQLQELSMSMRMVTVEGVFQKMARLVRDLSKKAGKNIDFVCSGEDTELDRTLVDKLTDPLVHMMRNSVDHGVENAQERQAKGKSEQGKITLSAYHQAGSIVIEIADDGKGLNRDKILKKAVEKGLVQKGQELPDEDIFKLIFLPGFSTADKITDVSGRGVGMDVVRKNIESLSGKIDIHSTQDKGTTFVIRLPLTLAIIDGQIVTVGSYRYIIPINSIIHSLKPTADQISTVQNQAQMVIIRGQLMPLVPLYKLFNAADAVADPTNALLVVVEEGSRKCCLQVDNLLGQQQVVIKSIQGMGTIKGVSGGAIMGDGRVSLILDIPGLMRLSQSGQN